MRRIAVGVIALLIATGSMLGQARTEYRAFWVDTFNTNLNNHTEVQAVVNNAKAAKANAIFAQVRRRGDSWYLNSLEPRADRTPIAPGFDPLLDLINTAHAEGIEVHAFVIMNAIWGRAPTLFPPENPNHAFNLHGGYNPATNTITQGPNNWLTRTLIADGTAGITLQGHRFVSDFWIDFGHPEAADYTARVVSHLVRNYDIDGLHLDRIRYPEIGISGQTPATGTSIGYNSTSIARFLRRQGLPESSPPPAQNNPQWNQWRRDQVTNVVRRVYLESIDIKPDLIVSAALIAFGGGPVCPFGQTCANDREIWEKSASAEAYWRVYQDWRAWTEEGIIDIAMPMAYKAEHVAAQVTQFNQWNEWTKNHQYNRGAMLGIGALSNAIEGTLRQTRRAFTPSTQGKTDLGVIYFSMATSNIAVTNNPFAIPPATTPARSFAEFASGLTTGGSVSGATRYEPAGLTPIFAEPANIPFLPWKISPTVGHLMGFARRPDSSAVDSGSVTIAGIGHPVTRQTVTDGNGFFGGVDLPPGDYLVSVQLGGELFFSCPVNVSAGSVARADVGLDPFPTITAPDDLTVSTDPGSCSAVVDPGTPTTTDNCGGLEVDAVRDDNQPLNAPFPKGQTTITWTVTDGPGQSATADQIITVVDEEAPEITNATADKTELWPANHKLVTVRVSYQAADNCGSVQTSLSVSSNEPVNGDDDGDTSPDWVIVDNHEVKLRAERAGSGQGRTYTITIHAVDSDGNSSTRDLLVLVPLSQGGQ